MSIITFNNVELHLQEHPQHEFLLTNKEVALGYGTALNILTTHRNDHSDELIEGKHWLRLEVQTKGGKQKVIHWTKKGIVRLGFFIKSENAKKFRDWAEDYIVNGTAAATPTQNKEIERLQEIILQQNRLLALQSKEKTPQEKEIDTLLSQIDNQEKTIKKYSDATFEFNVILTQTIKQLLRDYLRKTLEF